MAGNSKNKNSLFLIELMSAIFFFSLISAICIQVFTRAHLLSKSSEALDRAMILTQNAAECIKKAEDGTVALMAEHFEGEKISGQQFRAYFHEDFSSAEALEGSYYYMDVTLSSPDGQQPNLIIGEISFLKTDDQSDVFHLQVKKYRF